MNSNILRKIKRVKPLLKIRKHEMEKEAYTLSKLERERKTLYTEMKDKQKDYLEGIEKLNNIRSNSERKALTVFESSLDCVKEHWINLFKKTQVLDKKISAQFNNLKKSQQNLKSVELLKEKYNEEFKIMLSEQEQKDLEDFVNNQSKI